MGTRNRLYINAKMDAGSSGTVVDWTLPWNGELLQFSIHLSAAASTSEGFTLTKVNPTDADFTTLVRTLDLGANAIQDIVCPDVFQFQLGEHILVEYPNSDSLTVGFQMVVREAE